MLNDDERDSEEERFNRQLLETGDGEQELPHRTTAEDVLHALAAQELPHELFDGATVAIATDSEGSTSLLIMLEDGHGSCFNLAARRVN